MSAQSNWTFGDSTLRRIVEYEGPILSPFEIFSDCTQAHLDQNRAWLVPRFQDATSGTPDHHHPKLLDPAGRPYRAGGRLRRQRQGARTPSLSPPQLAVARNFAVRRCRAQGHRRGLERYLPCGVADWCEQFCSDPARSVRVQFFFPQTGGTPQRESAACAGLILAPPKTADLKQ